MAISCYEATDWETCLGGPHKDLEYQMLIPAMEKSPKDKRSYKLVRLANQMEVLAVHHPDMEKAAAVLRIGVGCMDEPSDIPGLAHFCEHLLFLGTEKYPDEAEYERYLKEHGK